MYTSMLNQTATWWKKTGQDGYNKPIFDSPKGLACRWEEGQSLSRNMNWEAEILSARVFLSSQVFVGDYLCLGTSTEINPFEVDIAGEVKAAPKIPSVDGNTILYMALVMRNG